MGRFYCSQRPPNQTAGINAINIPKSIFSSGQGVVPLRPRLENWMCELLQDRSRLDRLIERFGAPLNIQAVEPFHRNIGRLTDCVAAYDLPFMPMFARKANKCLSFVQAARDAGVGIDTASHAEVEQSLAQGIPGDRIVCTAAVKDRALITLCVRGGVTIILDNEDELALLEEVVEGAHLPVSVGLRLNGFERDGATLYSRFGFPLSEVKTLAKRIARNQELRLDGLHFHLNGYSAEDRIAAILQVLPLIIELKKSSAPLFFLDIGGGIPMNYLDDIAQWDIWLAELDRALAGNREPITQHNDGLGRKHGCEGASGKIESYPVAQTLVQQEWLRHILDYVAEGQTVAEHLKAADISLRCEPGRSLLDGCGLTIARVMFCKRDSAGTAVIGVEMNRTQSRSGFAEFALDPLMIPCSGPRGGAIEGYLAGTYCTESEWLTRRKMVFPQGIRAGDLLAFPNTAGYLMHFLESRSHQFPLAKNVFIQPDSETPAVLDDIDR